MLKRNRILCKRRNQWVQEASQCQCKKIVFTQKMTIQGTHVRTDTDIFTRIFQPRQRSILEYIYSKYQISWAGWLYGPWHASGAGAGGRGEPDPVDPSQERLHPVRVQVAEIL